jgi:hypothetical protein
MRDASTNSKDVSELFVEGSHHRNISVACILQNGFSKGKENRTMSINTQYIVLCFVASVYLIMNFFGLFGYICLASMAGSI